MQSRAACPLFDPERVRGYARVIVAVYALIAIGLFSGAFGKPLDNDFITYWSASYLTLEGHPAAAFDMMQNDSVQRLAVPVSSKIYPWHYPPTYQLLVLPLALLPYLPAYLSFIALSLLAYVAGLRRLIDWPDATFLLLAYPGAFICFLHGQNSLFTAALFAVAPWAQIPYSEAHFTQNWISFQGLTHFSDWGLVIHSVLLPFVKR